MGLDDLLNRLENAYHQKTAPGRRRFSNLHEESVALQEHRIQTSVQLDRVNALYAKLLQSNHPYAEKTIHHIEAIRSDLYAPRTNTKIPNSGKWINRLDIIEKTGNADDARAALALLQSNTYLRRTLQNPNTPYQKQLEQKLKQTKQKLKHTITQADDNTKKRLTRQHKSWRLWNAAAKASTYLAAASLALTWIPNSVYRQILS